MTLLHKAALPAAAPPLEEPGAWLEAAAPCTRTDGAPLVELRGAAVDFGPVPALRPLDLVLGRGDRLMLVGANGSGKTTLLRLLHGLLPCSGVRVEHPVMPSGGGAAHAPIGAMVFQHPFLLNLSVQWNLRVALWLRGVPAREHAARCDEALRRVGLSTQSARRARDLSGGQQQRLAFARAWALRPDILFLDEPTASLDPGAKREVETLIADFAAEGVTIAMSTHNLGQAKRLGTRVAYLEAGRLVTVRPVDDFFNGRDLPDAVRRFLQGELAWTT